MKEKVFGTLGSCLQHTLLASTIFMTVFILVGIIGIKFSLNENIRDQQVLDRIEEAGNSLYKSIIEQETGQRGYHLTGDKTFFEPLAKGKEDFFHSIKVLIKHKEDYPDLSDEINELIDKGQYWQEKYNQPLVDLAMENKEPEIPFMQEGKKAMDEFRSSFIGFTQEIEQERSIVRETMKKRVNITLLSLVFIVIVTMVLNLYTNIKVLRRIIHPIINLSKCVKAYARHDFTKKIPVYSEKDELAELIRNVGIMRSELANSIRQLELKANIDGLTGLYNRQYFNEFLHKHWDHAKEHNFTISIILLDIDYFKKFNDTYGHLAGDECLKQISNYLIQLCNRKINIAARYGGEEFAMVLLQRNEKETLAIADEIRKEICCLKIPHKSSPIHKYVTVSVGVATIIPDKNLMPNDLILMADKALYRAKKNGRNQVQKYTGTGE